jgi:CYTH domain-containing protein
MDNDPHSKINPEKQILDDNARKFICGLLDPSDLSFGEVTSFTLVTNWLETGEDNEKKLAYKIFENGDIQILLIAKVTKDGKRTTEKQKITTEEYDELLASSILCIEKTRHEFDYEHNGVLFSLKYDEFGESKPNVLEVDASTDRDRNSFDIEAFPAELTEVTGDMSYYGYRIAEHV